jgi:ferredoxin-nitrate reductase
LVEAAHIIGKSKALLSTALQGVYQSNQATASACQINNINLLLGRIGRPGCGIFQMNGQPTAQNNREVGCDGEYPGFRNHQNPTHMQELADLWNIEFGTVPHWNEPTHVQNILKYINNNLIQMLWISGTYPLVSLPKFTDGPGDTHKTRPFRCGSRHLSKRNNLDCGCCSSGCCSRREDRLLH